MDYLEDLPTTWTQYWSRETSRTTPCPLTTRRPAACFGQRQNVFDMWVQQPGVDEAGDYGGLAISGNAPQRTIGSTGLTAARTRLSTSDGSGSGRPVSMTSRACGHPKER
jgi:hypothetical protein